ncbi:dihydrofolate reductase family protein [Oerskovia sp. KBS0722]|uniref:dihydrofolate reductase family protein n=1 Tax=Oerskovia sp. KBS0722 TaxID=1179673 RepID=UPI00110DEA18|nr:dihydrofolate reductase family protein [Oerskovia sp. KBS0722]QDW63375.1 deaminase [Oerskovia sp. KBS0722]
MALLTCTGIMSLDGYVADASGSFAWSAPDEEVHAFVDDLERSVGTFLLGRRVYEVMRVWDDPAMLDDESPAVRDYARIWRDVDKVVYSTTLDDPGVPRTRVERTFDPAAARALVDRAEREVGIGGPTLAAQALAAGIVDELRVVVHPVLVGGGTSFYPAGVRLDLELLDERRFTGGVVYTRYRVVR